MKVLGISGSPRTGSITDQLVKEVLGAVEVDTGFLSLAGKQILPCVACLGCVRTNECILNDDMRDLRAAVVEADAYVIGAPNYFSMLNGLTHCFLERWYQFRHREGGDVRGKLGVAVGVGGGAPQAPAEDIQKFFEYNQVECLGAVSAQGPASCFVCGFGETCKVGAIHLFYGPGTKITPELVPCLEKQPEALENARALGRQLSDRLREFAAAT